MIDMMDEGRIDPLDVAIMALNWLSEDSVHEMMLANDLVDEDEDEEAEDDEEEHEEEEVAA
jgi:hypothetical protein